MTCKQGVKDMQTKFFHMYNTNNKLAYALHTCWCCMTTIAIIILYIVAELYCMSDGEVHNTYSIVMCSACYFHAQVTLLLINYA